MSDQIPFEPLVCSQSGPAQLSVFQRAEILKKVEIFSRATVEELLHLAAISCEIQWKAGKDIFREGDIADALYVVVKGKVELSNASFREVAGPFGAVGLYAVLSDEPRYASANVLEDSFALKIGAQDFFDLISQNIEIVQSLFRLLSQRLTSNGRE